MSGIDIYNNDDLKNNNNIVGDEIQRKALSVSM